MKRTKVILILTPDDELLSAREDELLGVVATAAELGVSRQAVVNWERLGRLEAIKSTRGVRFFLRSEINRFKAERNKR
jgi:predicted site-specific integrase-resolvase